MKKKLYIALLSVLAVFAFSFTCCYANNTASTAVDGIRNTVGGAENVIEDVGNGIVSGIRNVTDAGENTMNNMSNKVTGATTDNGNYTAARTTTRAATTETTGMSSTMWTWIIMGIVGIVIIALVWMYAKQNNNSYDE